MVSFRLCILETITVIETVFRLSHEYALMQDSNMSVIVPVEDKPRIEPFIGHSMHRTSIHHYARHGLCRNFEGKKTLYNALKTKHCSTKLSFTASFVIDLCRRRDSMLDKWFGELFDIDGDGYVTHHITRRTSTNISSKCLHSDFLSQTALTKCTREKKSTTIIKN